jgi:polar amino acid transport system permease protein
VVETAPYLLMALGRSWMLAIASLVLGALLALPLAAGRVFGPVGVRHLCVLIIEVVRATPELMVIFWIYFAYPALMGEALSPWSAAIVSLSIIAGVYLAEVIRGGLYSVPRTQWEAGISTGLTPFQTFRYIVLPQGVHSMIPAFIAQLVSSFKTTSLAYLIGVIEFFRAIILMNNTRFAPYAFYVTLACGYFVCCYALSWVIRRIDPGYSLVE